MREALSGTPIEQFVRPQPDDPPPHGILRGQLPEIKGKWDKEAGIIYTADCPVALGEPKTFKELHSTLFYVARDHPGGSPPSDPQNDPQFSRWEAGVAAGRTNHNEGHKNDPNEPQYVDSLPTLT